MKKTIFILSAIVLSGLAFDGCKKGSGDPMISLHTRKGRLTADWAISSGTSTSTSGSSTSVTTWTANTVTQGSTTGTNARYNLSIVKDGTWKLDEGYTITVGSSSTIVTITANGTWNWLGGVGDKKNKEQMIMRTLMETQTYGSSTTTDTYTGDSAPSTVYEIEELKSKEIKFTWAGTSTSGSTTTNDSGEMVFTKKK